VGGEAGIIPPSTYASKTSFSYIIEKAGIPVPIKRTSYAFPSGVLAC
jgi:hypothetical protein